jgi:hypothetical protein
MGPTIRTCVLAILAMGCDSSSTASHQKRVAVPRGGEPEGDYIFVPKDGVGTLCAVAGEGGDGPIQVRKPGAPPKDENERLQDLATEMVRKMLGELVASKGLRPESVPPVWIDEQVGGNVAQASILLQDRPPFKKGQQIVQFSVEHLLKHTQGSGTNKTVYFIFAHEMAHHLNGHQMNRPGQHNHDKELEADYFAGFVMGQRGDTQEEATAWIRTSAPVEATPSHPGRQQRLDHALDGWRRGQAAGAPPAPPAQ